MVSAIRESVFNMSKQVNHLAMPRPLTTELLTGFVLMAVIGWGRALIDIPNFHPVMAVALFAGYFFSRRWLAVVVPGAAMLLTDWLYFGGYHWPVMVTVYACLLMPVALGRWQQHFVTRRVSGRWTMAISIVGCSLVSAGLFFIATNLAFWFSFGLYENSAVGLLACYVTALPFLKWTLLSNLMFGVGLYCSYGCVSIVAQRSRESCLVMKPT